MYIPLSSTSVACLGPTAAFISLINLAVSLWLVDWAEMGCYSVPRRSLFRDITLLFAGYFHPQRSDPGPARRQEEWRCSSTRAHGQVFPQSNQPSLPHPYSDTLHRTETTTSALTMKNISSELIFQSSPIKPLSHHPRAEVCCELGTGNSVIVKLCLFIGERAFWMKSSPAEAEPKGKSTRTYSKKNLGINCPSCAQILVAIIILCKWW